MLSASILQALNTSLDPCEDFYEFASEPAPSTMTGITLMCESAGGWTSTHEIPADKGTYGYFNQVADSNKVS